MPSTQMQVGNQTKVDNGVANKPPPPPPPPSKLPPPPPPPPKTIRPLPPAPPPPPPPPPPPRNTSHAGINHLCSASGANSISGSLIHNTGNNNGTAVGAFGSAGRCGHVNQINGAPGPHLPPNQCGFTRFGDCGSRSSLSSHGSSMSHHHHGAGAYHGPSSNGGSVQSGPTQCNHQANIGCVWSANQQHDHLNPSNPSDTTGCSMYHGQSANCCSLHINTPTNKCQTPSGNLDMRPSGGVNTPSVTTISRNALFSNELDHHHPSHNPDSCCISGHPHPVNLAPPLHHHHHHHHHEQAHGLQGNSSHDDGHLCMTSPQPGCNGINHLHEGVSNVPILPAQQCGHINKYNGCNHQPNECFDHHPPTNVLQQQQVLGAHHVCCGSSCSHPHNGTLHHECNTNSTVMTANNLGGDNCQHRHHHHHHHVQPPCPHAVQARCLESSSNDVLSSTTAHVHNLSNSSTTTHTSNVAVKHQFPNHRPILSRGARSNSSQQYDQYGLSSAASTSSATASLSSYQAPVGYDDGVPPYLSSRVHQPLPPAPPPATHNFGTSAAKSQPASPSHQMFINNNNAPLFTSQQNTISNLTTSGNPHSVGQPQNVQPPPPPPPPLPPLPSQFHISQHPLPPLPPKPVSPNASSCSTQMTTVRTSPSLHSQPITRITSQAGLQGPLPSSDIPPPLPPLKHGFRTQPLVNTSARTTEDPNAHLNKFEGPTLNYSRGGIITAAERKTEAISRQVEIDLDNKRRSGQPLGTCGICATSIMPSQDACEAENQLFHKNCFVCCECGRTLQGKKYYSVGDRAYCEEDYQYTGHLKSLEKCAACGQPIFNMILPALGKYYHPKCFKCCICSQCLDGVPFTIDRKNNIYCVKDYHNIYSPKCAACGKPISPIDGTGETVRVVSMDKDYHVDCYCCEDCGLPLTDEEPSRCFPLDNHLLCQKCHINRLTRMKAALSLN